jgi:hypothetical protein
LDGSQRAAINGAGQDRCIATQFGQHYITIDGFELYGVNTGTRRCLSFGSTSAAVSNFVTIRNCYIHSPVATTADVNGISGFGSDAIIENNIITNIPTDGIWMQGLRPIIRRNRISNVATDGRAAGDCIQVYGDATLGSYGGEITDNFCDHSNVGVKQAIIYQDANGGIGGLIQGNECVMADYDGVNATNTIFMEIVGGRIIGNRVRGGLYGIFMNSAGVVVSGNLVADPVYGITQLASTTGGLVHCNTVDCASIAGIYADTDTTFAARNNILMNCLTGMSHENGATENYNCFYGNTTDKSSLGGGAVSLGAQSITSDPLLDASYRPSSSSPCVDAGTQVAGVVLRDFYGKEINGTPDIGAVQRYAARSASTARTESTARTASTTRSYPMRRGIP